MTVPVLQNTPSTDSAGITDGSTASATTVISSVAPTAQSDRVCLVFIGYETTDEAAAFPASVSWGGNNFTLLENNPTAASADNNMSVWYLLDADFPASAGDITVTWGGGTFASLSGVCAAFVYSGVDQTPANWDTVEGEASDPSITLTPSYVDGMMLGAMGHGGNYVASTTVTPTNLSNSSIVLDRDDAGTGGTSSMIVAVGDSTAINAKTLQITVPISEDRPCHVGVWLPEPQGGGGSSVVIPQQHARRRR